MAVYITTVYSEQRSHVCQVNASTDNRHIHVHERFIEPFDSNLRTKSQCSRIDSLFRKHTLLVIHCSCFY